MIPALSNPGLKGKSERNWKRIGNAKAHFFSLNTCTSKNGHGLYLRCTDPGPTGMITVHRRYTIKATIVQISDLLDYML